MFPICKPHDYYRSEWSQVLQRILEYGPLMITYMTGINSYINYVLGVYDMIHKVFSLLAFYYD